VNVDQAKSEIVALNSTAAVVEAPIAQDAPVAVAESKAPVAEKPVMAKEEKPATTTEKQESHKPHSADKRASNDPRMRRRQKREAHAKQAQAPKLNPSQVPTLGQYTVGSLIRHVYGEDCSVLIEQFGLIPTFNRALVKFTEQYAATMVSAETQTEAPAQPVTRDVAVTKAAPEAEPAPVLDLTPPAAVSDNRVANDPRERRRLAKLAAEQALEQAKQAHSEPEAAKEVVETAAAEATPVVEQQAAIEEVPATGTPEVTVVAEVAAEPINEAVKKAPVEKKSAPKPVQSELPVEAAQDVQALAEPKADADTPETEDEADKPVRPRRPRGRPPKKVTPANES
jgi:ribonuclease E